jgi:HSP20 family molecular chaperone IbpA
MNHSKPETTTTTESKAPAPLPQAERQTFRPNVDIRDLGGEVVIHADIPGARRESVDVSFEDGVLSLHADVPPRELAGVAVRKEYGVGDYRRAFRLGEGFDASRITADYRDGVLTMRVPRLAAVLPRKIAVNAG